MMMHYCQEEKTWLSFESKCSWCGMPERNPPANAVDCEDFAKGWVDEAGYMDLPTAVEMLRRFSSEFKSDPK